MKKYWILKGIKIAVLILLGIIAFTFVVMSLWNWLMPAIFGLPAIGFFQALGLLILSKILFGGGFHKKGFGGRRHNHWKARMAEKWSKMSDEERDKFKMKFKKKCGWYEDKEEMENDFKENDD